MLPMMASDPVSLQVPLIGVWAYNVQLSKLKDNID
jgi:hypothetical protein